MKKLLLLFLVFSLVSALFAGGGGQQGTGATGSAAWQPIPYPANTNPMDSSHHVIMYDLDQIFSYRALPRYSEPDYVADLVRQGRLPPVEQRLPRNPQVIETSFMPDGPGEYGGVSMQVFAQVIQGWNYVAGTAIGAFGIEACVTMPLLYSGPAYLRRDRIEPMPNLATHWEWSGDGRQLTMYLLQGARWSDGHPFTADDIMFTWEDNINDLQVPARSRPATWSINGQPSILEKIDDYTIRWTFAEPFPAHLLWAMGDDRFTVGPAHALRHLHPKYNPNATYLSYRQAYTATQLPFPTMGPWVASRYITDELLVLTRNPYFWKVDSDGRQLPYICEVQFTFTTNSLARTLNTMTGTCDVSNVGEGFDDVARRSVEAGAPFMVNWQGDSHGYGMEFNLDPLHGVQTDQDRANRQLFRDLRFRRALTMALDRDGISASLAMGPFFRTWAGGILPAGPLFTRESVFHYPYNVAAANALLDEMGLTRGPSGMRQYPAGSGNVSGRDIEIQMVIAMDLGTMHDISAAAIPMFQAIGIRLTSQILTGPVLTERNLSGQWDMRMTRYDTAWRVPNAFPNNISPKDDNIMTMHYRAMSNNSLMPFEVELNRITDQLAMELNPDRQRELVAQFNRTWTENAYTIGNVSVAYGFLINRFKRNVQPGISVNVYSWGHQAMFMEQNWFDRDYQNNSGRRHVMVPNLPLDYPNVR